MAQCSILINGRAGALKSTPGPDDLRRVAHDIGLDVEVIPTDSAEEMRERIRDLVRNGARRLAVAGGDGTVGLAVQELAHTETVLGIIPQGTANNFAAALRLPQDLPAALRVLQDGEVRRVDLGHVCDWYFTEAAGVGLFADALVEYGEANKNPWRALRAMIHVLRNYKARRMKLTVDGRVFTERAVLCTVANAARMAQQLSVAPSARITDGKLDLVIVGDLSRRELWTYYRALRSQRHLDLPKAHTVQAREITIESRRPLNVHCDDKIVGRTPVTINAHAGALRVLIERL